MGERKELSVTSVELEKKLSTLSLPMLPQILVKVRKVISDDKSSASDLADVILQDQTLTARILGVVNSPYYSHFAHQVSTVTQAIVVMGFEAVRNATLGMAVYNLMGKLSKEKELKDFWLHSLSTAVCAQKLTESIGLKVPEEAFVAGLLHDIGKIVLDQCYPEDYNIVKQMVVKGEKTHISAERDVLNCDHAQAGEIISKKWGFPKPLVEAIRNHHEVITKDKYEPSREYVGIVYIADLISNNLYGPLNLKKRMPIELIKRHAKNLFHLEEKSIDKFLSTLGSDIENISSILEIDIEDLKLYTVMVEEEIVRLKEIEKEQETLQQQAAMKTDEINLINMLSNSLLSETPINDIFTMALDGIIQCKGVNRVVLLLKEPEHNTLRVLKASGNNISFLNDLTVPLNLESGILARTVIEGRPYNVIDVNWKAYDSLVNMDLIKKLKVKAFATCPISASGNMYGLLYVDNHISKRVIKDEEVESLSVFANHIALALQKQGKE